MRAIAVIPARYGSTRFPGKPLAKIHGKPMIQWVWENVSKVEGLDRIVVATDHDEIANCVTQFGGEVMMTLSEHPSGTDRCMETVNKVGGQFDTVINVQGDEPFIQPQMVSSLLELMARPECGLGTLIKPIANIEELLDPNKVKAVVDTDGRALYFSRSPIPFLKDYPAHEWLNHHAFYKHIGIYGYKPEVLNAIIHLSPSALEKAESLEQLRWLENGLTIHTALTRLESPSVDTVEDLNRLEALDP